MTYYYKPFRLKDILKNDEHLDEVKCCVIGYLQMENLKYVLYDADPENKLDNIEIDVGKLEHIPAVVSPQRCQIFGEISYKESQNTSFVKNLQNKSEGSPHTIIIIARILKTIPSYLFYKYLDVVFSISDMIKET